MPSSQMYLSKKDAHLIHMAVYLLRRTYLLSDEELERLMWLEARLNRFLDGTSAQKLCECGCGREISLGSRNPRRYFNGACRARALRSKRGHPPIHEKEEWA